MSLVYKYITNKIITMALSKKKLQAIKEVRDAEEQLRIYRGLPMESIFELGCDLNPDRYTVAEMNFKRDSLIELTKMPIKEATEKQMNFMTKLVKHKDLGLGKMEFLLDQKLNIFQAKELINFFAYIREQLLYNYNYLTVDDCEQFDSEILTLENFYKKFFGIH